MLVGVIWKLNMALAFEMRISGSLVSPLHGDSFIYSLAADQANFPGVRVLLCPTLPHAEINSEERGKAQKKTPAFNSRRCRWQLFMLGNGGVLENEVHGKKEAFN